MSSWHDAHGLVLGPLLRWSWFNHILLSAPPILCLCFNTSGGYINGRSGNHAKQRTKAEVSLWKHVCPASHLSSTPWESRRFLISFAFPPQGNPHLLSIPWVPCMLLGTFLIILFNVLTIFQSSCHSSLLHMKKWRPGEVEPLPTVKQSVNGQTRNTIVISLAEESHVLY